MYKKFVNTQAHELTRHINKTTINEIYTVFEMQLIEAFKIFEFLLSLNFECSQSSIELFKLQVELKGKPTSFLATEETYIQMTLT